MKDHPTLMAGESVRAILAGRKTMTRRIAKSMKGSFIFHDDKQRQWDGKKWKQCPFGQPGDRLVIKEAYQIKAIISHKAIGCYLADNTEFNVQLTESEWKLWCARKKPYAKTSGMFMYKSLGRLRPPIVSVKIEQVQEISHEDAKSEGVNKLPYNDMGTGSAYRDKFAEFWDSIHGKGAWDRNDWVWAIKFKETKP